MKHQNLRLKRKLNSREQVTPDMYHAGSSSEQLVLLFDRESLADLDCWLPTDTQLTQWISVTLAQSISPALESVVDASKVSVEISLTCVSGDQMCELNAQYRDKDRVTNVLSFPANMPVLPAEVETDHATLVLGDIIICPEVLHQEATEQNKLLEHHWAHMVVHSVLHLNGLDHENENAAKTMESCEIQILSNFGISNPYLAVSAEQS